MLTEKFLLILLMATVTFAIPRPDDSDESKDDDDDICSQPAIERGKPTCRAFLPRWTFNTQLKVCQPITYGGCRGTKNLFETEYACNSKCNRKALLRAGPGARDAGAPSPCILAVAAGNCRAIIPSFYYDAASGSCKSFAYTGCKGNANNFVTIEDCQRTCGVQNKKTALAVTLPAPIKVGGSNEANQKLNDICNLPPIENTNRVCMAFIPSWTFNAKSGKCESYVYGGCGKTANLFKTERECQTTCASSGTRASPLTDNRESCLLPVVKGPCFGFMKRYTFNKDKNRCEMFTYGGCQGNANNFATADQCFEACGGELPSLTTECEQVSCPVSNKRYLDKGCRPVYKGKACCPTSFSCPKDKSMKGVCHYGGITYELGQKVAAVTEDHPCKIECYCVSSVEHQDGATIKCTEMECPVTHASTSKDCQLVTKPNQCCPTVECHDHSSEEKEVDICFLEGKEYTKGQAIPTGDPCRVCSCVQGFTGLNGPGCREIHCLIDNKVGCVPIYTENVCCPTSYKCAKNANSGVDNTTRIIRVDGEPGKQGAVTLPFIIPGGNYKKWQVKDKLCLLPKDIGPCKMSTPSFYYDGDQLKCLPFLYGGCKGNANRFETEEQCLSTCQYSDSEINASTHGGQPDVTKQGSSPFISSGAAVTLPALAVPPRNQGTKDSSPLITSGAATTLPAAVAPPRGQETKGPFITNGAAVTLPALIISGENKNYRPSRCLLPMQIGPCRMSMEMFYFDTKHQECRLFFYGGCKGNSNQFKTVQECQETCRVQPSSGPVQTLVATQDPDITSSNEQQNVCELPQKTGPCRGQVPSYFYNQKTGACEAFWYGGCRGNGNRFETEVECQSRCVTNTAPSGEVTAIKATTIAASSSTPAEVTNEPSSTVSDTSIPAHCQLPADMGPCRASDSRFFYNAAVGECQLFRYGGCRGNLNNFQTIEQCQSQCLAAGAIEPSQPLQSPQGNDQENDSTCVLPSDAGFCRAFQERFFYDSVDNQCKTFSWGGCLGNANNFATLEDCLAMCSKKPVDTVAAVQSPKSRARARFDEPTDVKENEHLAIEVVSKVLDSVCTFGNETLNLGDRLASEDPCEECVCSTPPELTCIQHTCPPPPTVESGVHCQAFTVPGQCCPDYGCVSAFPPSIDVCAGVVCQENEHCEPKSQEAADGSWMEPIGVCVANVLQ